MEEGNFHRERLFVAVQALLRATRGSLDDVGLGAEGGVGPTDVDGVALAVLGADPLGEVRVNVELVLTANAMVERDDHVLGAVLG